MQVSLNIILAVLFMLTLTACGVKGKLKTPEQIEKLEAKEAKRVREEATRNADSREESMEESVEKYVEEK